MERKAYPATVSRTRGFHQGNVDEVAMVCRRRDEHVWRLHDGADRPLVRATILRQPGWANQRAGIPARAPLAKCRTIQPGCVVRKISGVHAPGREHLLL